MGTVLLHILSWAFTSCILEKHGLKLLNKKQNQNKPNKKTPNHHLPPPKKKNQNHQKKPPNPQHMRLLSQVNRVSPCSPPPAVHRVQNKERARVTTAAPYRIRLPPVPQGGHQTLPLGVSPFPPPSPLPQLASRTGGAEAGAGGSRRHARGLQALSRRPRHAAPMAHARV